MKTPLRAVIAVVLITLLAGVAGGVAGFICGERSHEGRDLNSVIHQQLGLTAEQNRQVEALEVQFRKHEKAVKAEMRAANRELAAALDQEHAYGPRAQAAMDRFHKAEEDLQASTIKHVLAMRAILNPEQARKLDQTIHKALTAGS
jgi:nickel and cobalt resistance protein CnrR